MLLRDADAEWPGAFGARTTFGEIGVSEDDAFGPSWPGLPPVEVDEIWRNGLSTPELHTLSSMLDAWSLAWSIPLAPFSLGPVSEHVIVAGPSAIAAAITASAEPSGPVWREQIVIVAFEPSHRQLAFLGGALVRSPEPTRVLSPGEIARTPRRGRPVVSADATKEEAAAARSLGV